MPRERLNICSHVTSLGIRPLGRGAASLFSDMQVALPEDATESGEKGVRRAFCSSSNRSMVFYFLSFFIARLSIKMFSVGSRGAVIPGRRGAGVMTIKEGSIGRS